MGFRGQIHTSAEMKAVSHMRELRRGAIINKWVYEYSSCTVDNLGTIKMAILSHDVTDPHVAVGHVGDAR